MVEEIWKDIKDCEGYYQVSNLGQVKSLSRINEKGVLIEEKILKPSKISGNHLVVGIRINCKGKTTQVSVLVAKAFPEICGEWFKGCHIHHKDHNPENNSAENLICLSPKEHYEIHRRENISDNPRIIYKYDVDWNFLEVFDNTRLAAASVYGKAESLNKVLREDTHFYRGYNWLLA